MKKSLLLATLASVASLTLAEQKTVVFNFSDPTVYGYEKPADGAFTNLSVGDKISSDGVDIEALTNGTTSCRFYNSDGAITLRMASDCSMSVSAGGNKITSLSLTGSNITYNTNFSSNQTGWDESAWTGSAESITIVRTKSTLQIATMTVIYETEEEGGETGGTTTVTEKYVAIDANGIKDCFANATSDGAKSIVSFSTDKMDVEAVGGRTPKDVKLGKDQTFTGWTEWNEPKWDEKSQNLNDLKPGVDTIHFYYIQGTGNPAVEIGVDEPTEKDDSLVYKAKYTYYSPDGSLGMPVMGLYYKFTPKVNGTIKAQIWANKGNRYTYVVKESAKTPIAYTKEGYINNVSRTIEATMKSLMTGEDSIGTMNEKVLLNNAQIDSIHEAVLWKYTYVDKNGTTTKELTAAQIADSIAAGVITAETPIDTVKSHGVNDPYIIAGGNQAFWGWITFEVEAGESYWLFQHSSQVGFSGYEFTYETESTAIETLAQDPATSKGGNRTYNMAGQLVNSVSSGNLYLRNGKKILVR